MYASSTIFVGYCGKFSLKYSNNRSFESTSMMSSFGSPFWILSKTIPCFDPIDISLPSLWPIIPKLLNIPGMMGGKLNRFLLMSQIWDLVFGWCSLYSMCTLHDPPSSDCRTWGWGFLVASSSSWTWTHQRRIPWSRLKNLLFTWRDWYIGDSCSKSRDIAW